jgi:predicted transcriptional regulator
MGITFFICTLVHTGRSGVIAWKSSAIVPLLTAMDGWNSDELRATSERDVEKRSNHMRGLLVPDAQGGQSFRRE